MAVGNSYVPLTFERIFRDPSGFALLSHLSRLPARSAGEKSCHEVTERGKSYHEVTAAVGNAALGVPLTFALSVTALGGDTSPKGRGKKCAFKS